MLFKFRHPETTGLAGSRALAELDGCLCMIRDLRRRRDVAAMFEVWKLKDYESGVWSLDYRIHEDLLATYVVVVVSADEEAADGTMAGDPNLLSTF